MWGPIVGARLHADICTNLLGDLSVGLVTAMGGPSYHTYYITYFIIYILYISMYIVYGR